MIVHVIEGNNPSSVQRNSYYLANSQVLGFGLCDDAVDTTMLNRLKYQYSLRLARPEKVAYFLKQVETAVMKFIILFSLSIVVYKYNKSVDVTKPQLLLDRYILLTSVLHKR